VIERPGHGAELDRRFGERFGFWQPVGSSHRDLGWLYDRGYIRHVEQTEGDALTGSRSVRYETTPQGMEFFEAWLRKSVGPDAPPLRSELLLKVSFPATSDELLELWHQDARMQEQWCVDRINALAEPGDVEALAEGHKDLPVLNPLLLREAETVYWNAIIECLTLVITELRRVYERRTGRRLAA